ncbi:MAG: phosphatase PAP2 family protein [Micrococcales bacterium]|nr:phosphatase PAP2 family protein [Micrococcales bacterium]
MLLDQSSLTDRLVRRYDRRTWAAVAAVIAGLCVLGVWALWWVFVASPTGRWVDQLAMRGALYDSGRLPFAKLVLDPVSVVYGAVGLAVVVSIAVLRRRWRLAVVGAVLLGAPVLTTQVLKLVLLTRPALGDGLDGSNSLPSGHTTAAAATCAALLFVVGPRWRPVVAVLGAAYTVLTGWSTYVGQWHRPSDVLAAVAVVTGWSAVASLLLVVPAPLTGAVSPEGTGRRTAAWTPALLLVGTLVSAVVLVFLVTALHESVGGTLGGEAGRQAAVLAYGGGVVATVGGVCAMVAVQLALRTAVGRVRSDQ